MIRFFPFFLPLALRLLLDTKKKFCIQNFFFLMTSSMLRTKWLNFFVHWGSIVPHLEKFYKKMVFQISWNDFRNFLVKWEKNLLHLFLITFYRQSDRRFFFHLIGLNCTHRTAHSKLVDLEPLKKTHIGPKNQNTALLMWPNLTSINHLGALPIYTSTIKSSQGHNNSLLSMKEGLVLELSF